jgi:hypothetical protein
LKEKVKEDKAAKKIDRGQLSKWKKTPMGALDDSDFMSRMKSIQIINRFLTQNNRDTVKLVFYSITK